MNSVTLYGNNPSWKKGAVLDGALLYKTRFVDAKGVEEWIVQNDIHTATYIKKPR